MSSWMKFAFLVVAAALAFAQPPGTVSPLAEDCGFGGTVVCINKYAAVMPYSFNRSVTNRLDDNGFDDTTVGNDTSFGLVQNASFVVFDRARGLELLGSNPSYQFVFRVADAIHEAPVYVPSQNKLYLSQLAPPPGYLPQLVVDLNRSPPTLSEYLPDPPIYAPNGGTFSDGKILFGASGGNNSIGGTEQRPSIQTVDPATNKSTVLLNNYFGLYFNGINDLVVHPRTSNIFFTDPQYAWATGVTDTAPQLPAASYRFNPTTGAAVLIDDTLSQPNGLSFTPDARTLYIADSGAALPSVDPNLGPVPLSYNLTYPRTIYAFDVSADGNRVDNKRAFYLVQDGLPDGLKVSRDGYVVVAAGRGVDVIDEFGQLVLRVQTEFPVQNFAFTGPELKTMWLVGSGGISKVEWEVRGQELR